MMLTPESFSKARDFLLTKARPLERALYRFHFAGVPAAEARAALASFQNNNGGFGRGLEPDLRLPASSAIVTSVAFQHLRELGLLAEDPMVRAALRWTQSAFDRELDHWPAVPPAVNDWPHAPWWTWKEPGARGFTANPGVELAAHLWHYRSAVDAAFLTEITTRVEQLVEALPEEPVMHDLLCLLHLAETPFVPATLREAAMEYVRWAGPVIVARDPQAWTGYGLQPLMLAPRVDSLMEPLLSEALSANLDFVINRQGADGAWPPNWNWMGLFPEDWPQAELEWKGVLTLQTLLTLRSYGRLPVTPLSSTTTPA